MLPSAADASVYDLAIALPCSFSFLDFMGILLPIVFKSALGNPLSIINISWENLPLAVSLCLIDRHIEIRYLLIILPVSVEVNTDIGAL